LLYIIQTAYCNINSMRKVKDQIAQHYLSVVK